VRCCQGKERREGLTALFLFGEERDTFHLRGSGQELVEEKGRGYFMKFFWEGPEATRRYGK